MNPDFIRYLLGLLQNLLRRPRRRRFIRWLFKIGEAQEYPPLALALRWVLMPVYSFRLYQVSRPVDWFEFDFTRDRVKLFGLWWNLQFFEDLARPGDWVLTVEKKDGRLMATLALKDNKPKGVSHG